MGIVWPAAVAAAAADQVASAAMAAVEETWVATAAGPEAEVVVEKVGTAWRPLRQC